MSFAEFPQRDFISDARSSGSDAIDIDRVAAVAHYVIAKTEPGKLGYVKLNRILWYSDLEYFRWHGRSVTELRHYSRLALGPMSWDISRAVGRLVRERKVVERAITTDGFTRREMVSLVEPDLDPLTVEQTGILDQMIEIIAPLSAKRFGEMVHQDRLWQETKNGDAMSIATGSIMTRPLTSLQLPSWPRKAAHGHTAFNRT